MRKEEEMPSYFRCPISLDLMKFPVSLSTGVTYDRSSIQRWLDSGHNTCPATMQVLPSPDFVPNLNLLRLIRIWSLNLNLNSDAYSLSPSHASSLAHDLSSSFSDDDDHNDCFDDRFLSLLCFASQSTDNARLLSRNDAFLRLLVRKTTRVGQDDSCVVEAAVKILREIVRSYRDDDDGDSDSKSSLRSHFLNPESLSSAGRILRFARRDSRIAVADLIESLASDFDSKIAVLDCEEILTELIRGLDPIQDSNSSNSKPDPSVSDAFLSCIVSLSTAKINKQRLVRAGVVRAVGRLLTRHDTSAGVTEAGMKLLEGLLGCSEGRSEICGDRECIAGVLGRLMRSPESGISVLWSACCWLRDRRAREAVAKEANAPTRILLVMQSGCSPAAKRMCGDLLRVIRANSKTAKCLGSYDTHSSHIMPF